MAAHLHPEGILRLRVYMLAFAPVLLAMATPHGFRLDYAFNLATLSGDVRTSSAYLNFDSLHRELYVVGYGVVRVFNEAGMETFRFGDDEAMGSVYGVAALEDGDLLVLSYLENKFRLLRCNFRGEPVEPIELRGVPAEYASFGANAVAYAKGRVYLADQGAMRVLVVDPAGKYLASYDLAALIGEADKRQDQGLNGFAVDRDGNMLFTVAPLFKVFVVSADGKVRSFGRPGSAPGFFSVVAGVGTDSAGRYYVADSLKCAVLVFDRDFQFIGEYGTRGVRPGQLIGPTSLAVSDREVFVSQNGDRGVAVYQLRGD